MTRLTLTLVAALLAAAGTVFALAGELHRAATPTSVHAAGVTASTDDLRPLLDASIAAAGQAAKVCEKP